MNISIIVLASLMVFGAGCSSEDTPTADAAPTVDMGQGDTGGTMDTGMADGPGADGPGADGPVADAPGADSAPVGCDPLSLPAESTYGTSQVPNLRVCLEEVAKTGGGCKYQLVPNTVTGCASGWVLRFTRRVDPVDPTALSVRSNDGDVAAATDGTLNGVNLTDVPANKDVTIKTTTFQVTFQFVEAAEDKLVISAMSKL